MLTSIASTPLCFAIIYWVTTIISNDSSSSIAIQCSVPMNGDECSDVLGPMCLARLKRRSQIASDAGVAKKILGALSIKGKCAEFSFYQSSNMIYPL